MKIIGIYKITNLVNGSVYIGQSRDCVKREDNYKKLNCKGQIKVYRSIKKYGWENFSFDIILNCEIEELNKYEYEIHQKYLLELGSVKMLNCKAGGGQTLWVSEETRKKISESSRGRLHSDESKRKMSESSTGRPKSDEHRKKLSESAKGSKGRVFTDETRKKISESKKGKPKSDEHKKKMSDAAKNMSDEHKKKMSEAAKNRSDETRKKMGESNKKKINQHDLDGTFIKTWDSLMSIKEFYNTIKKVPICCQGKLDSAYGFIWRYFKEYPECENLLNVTT